MSGKSKKTYAVIQDGVEIGKANTLTAAKVLADDEKAEVYANGKCVYSAGIRATAYPAKELDGVVNKPQTSRYRLKSLMNVRDKPTLSSRVIATKPEGTIVTVVDITNGWLELQDGGYILCEGGKWAEAVGK